MNQQKKVIKEPIMCPYCGNPPEWVENKEIYGKNFGESYMCYLCRPCKAYVGCHQNSKKPLGSLADTETRYWRRKAHAAFDPLWKEGYMSRNAAYQLLGDRIGHEVHIGWSDIDQCKKIIEIASEVAS